MSDVTATNPDYERLMGTLPAMLAMSINAGHNLVQKVNFRLDGSCTIGRGRFEGFVKAAQTLIARRDEQKTIAENGTVEHDGIFVPVIGQPYIGQPVVNENSDDVEIRADLVGRLFQERKLLDQILGQFREIVAGHNQANAVRAGDGGVYAYKVPARLVENVLSFIEAPLLSQWQPGEFRSVEVAIALKEALGLPTQRMENLFENNAMPRLMPRAHEVLAHSNAIPATASLFEDQVISVDEMIAELEDEEGHVVDAAIAGEVTEPSVEAYSDPSPSVAYQMAFEF